MIRHTLVDLKILLRSPLAVFFNNIFPLFLITCLLISYGNISIGNNLLLVNKLYLTALAVGLAPITLLTFSSTINEIFCGGIFKREYLYGIKPSSIIVSQIILCILTAIVQFIITTIYLSFFFKLNIDSFDIILKIFINYIIVLIPLMALGFLLGIISKKSSVTLSIGLFIMFAFMFFAGVFGKSEFTGTLKVISEWIPLTYISTKSFVLYTADSYIVEGILKISLIYTFVFVTISGLIIRTLTKFTRNR